MCGIVAALSAYNNGFSYEEARAFTAMLFVDTLRGFDSTGVFGVKNNGLDVEAHKAALAGPDFIKTPTYENFRQTHVNNGIIMVGHNRAATRGEVTDTNAHPFWVDDKIFLVHNGTWNGDHKSTKDTTVDSEAIAHLLSENQDIEAALQKVNAAYALVWYDISTKTLNCIRNAARPLCIGYTKQGTILLASELSTIVYAAMRENIQLKEKPYEIEVGHLCSWTVDQQTLTFSQRKLNHHYKGGLSNQNFHSQPWQYQPSRHSFHRDDVDDIPLHPGTPASNAASIHTTMRELVDIGTFPDNEVPGVTAHLIAAEYQKKQDKLINIEWVDYIKCNNHPQCESFYIIGAPITPDIQTVSPVCYTIHKGTEEEAMNMIGNLYSARMSHIMVHSQTRSGKHLTTLFCHNLTPLEIINA